VRRQDLEAGYCPLVFRSFVLIRHGCMETHGIEVA
jgi:hypothetical protein